MLTNDVTPKQVHLFIFGPVQMHIQNPATTCYLDLFGNAFLFFQICTELGLCSTEVDTFEIEDTIEVNSSEEDTFEVYSSEEVEADAPYCMMCEYVVGEIDKYITDNRTEEYIQKTVEQIYLEPLWLLTRALF